MTLRHLSAALAVSITLILVLPPGFALAASETVTIGTNSPSYVGTGVITVVGYVLPPPGASSQVLITTYNPNGLSVNVGLQQVRPVTGEYNYSFIIGSGTFWVNGVYSVDASWTGNGTTAGATTTFAYAASEADSVTLNIYPPMVIGNRSFFIFGSVTASSGSVSGTSVGLTLVGPGGTIVLRGGAFVVGSGFYGNYSAAFVAGGPSWVSGNYTVQAYYTSTQGYTSGTASSSFTYSFVPLSNALAVATPPSQTNINGYSGVRVAYTNNYPAPLSTFVWVTVRNSAGQTVGVFAGSMTINLGVTVTAFVPTINMPSGNYTATLFVTTTRLADVSPTSSLSVSY